MVEAPRKQALKPLLEACCGSIRDALTALLKKPVALDPKGLCATTPDQIAQRLRAPVAVVRGRLVGEPAGQTMRVVCDATEAATMAAAATMASDAALLERRLAGALEADALAAFTEVANALCASIDGVLRSNLGEECGLRLQDHATFVPHAGEVSVLGAEPLYEMTLSIRVADFPATRASILIDRETGDRWNGGSVEFAPGMADQSLEAGGECADDEPAAPVRGRLAAFLVDGHTVPTLRKVCRRIGLELDKRPRGEVPNPAANRDAVVFIEVPPSDDRRFDWCRRIKTFRPETRVALLLALPSRHQVLQAARAGADVILGQPIHCEHLAQKLNALLEPEPSNDDPRVPAP